MNVDLQGRTAKAHIDKWEQYGEKARQHATSAAIILCKVRPTLGNGQWGAWLKKYEIVPRTASRLMLEYQQPEKKEERQEKDRDAKASDRATLRNAKAFQSESGRKVPDNPLMNNETTINEPTLEPLMDAIRGLSTEDFAAFKVWFLGYCGAINLAA